MQVTFSLRYLRLGTYYISHTFTIESETSAILEFTKNVATQFAITQLQTLQDNHIIHAVLINLPSFLSLPRNIQFIHSPKLVCYI